MVTSGHPRTTLDIRMMFIINPHLHINRREFIKKSAVAAAGGLLLTTPLGQFAAQGREDETETKNINDIQPMKVLLINGSARKKGNTFTALSEVAKQLEKNGIEAEIVQIGAKPIRGCVACGQCKSKGLGKCVFDDDICNQVAAKMAEADALVVGSPVYYGQPNGSVLSLMQRLFYSAGATVSNKPAAAVCVCRRGGATAAFQTLNMPFQMMNMPVVTSQYWNIVYGAAEGQAALDTEGMQTMRTLADNMAWMLKKIHAGGKTEYPEREPWQMMNFVR